MKLLSWNVNGIRAAYKNGFLDWLTKEKADVVCLQEIKATQEQVPDEIKRPLNYFSYWNPAQKAGYSGTAIYSKKEPDHVSYGLGVPEGLDHEGRTLIAQFGKLTLINAYFPNSQRDHARLKEKLAFCTAMMNTIRSLTQSGQYVVLCGDFNIAHKEIDLKNPKSNMNNAGFLPEERAWFDEIIQTEGMIDTFRHFNKDPGHYTWWSYRPGVRQKNIGWRLDYHVASKNCLNLLQSSQIQSHVMGSDHCPVELILKEN